MLFFLIHIYIDNSIRLPAGVQSNGLGGITLLISEGLSAFHNPVLIDKTKFSFVLSRWYNETNLLNLGAEYKDYGFGISYLNYGKIQGYDEYGFPTHEFTPYDLTLAVARRLSIFGFNLKNFQTKIDSILFLGFAGGISSLLEYKNITLGIRIDNLGAEILNKVDVPIIIGSGCKLKLPEGFSFFIEARGMNFELSSGFLYYYENLKIFCGIKYLSPQKYVDRTSFADINFSGGLTISFDEYEIGYSFVYTSVTSAHLVGIIFTP